MCCPSPPFAAIARRDRKRVMTHPKPDPAPADARAPIPSDMLHSLQSEMEALLLLLPGAALYLSPPGQPDEEAVEAGFDNMPV